MFLLMLTILVSQDPDRTGEVAIDSPTYKGQTAAAPIPPELHIQNEGGSNGAGLCVISSILANGRYQQVPALAAGKQSELWKTAKRRPGGYYPEKLTALVDQTVPNEKYASYEGADPSVLDTLSNQGYPIGATMSTGALYGYRRIHHMISLIHYRTGGYACVVDNNDPGKYHWMPATEFAKRWIDGDNGWAWIWTRTPKQAVVSGGVAVFVFLGLLAWRAVRRLAFSRASLASVVFLTACQAAFGQVDPLTAYERWTDPAGRTYLKATVQSATYGPTTVYARPNNWPDATKDREPKSDDVPSKFSGVAVAAEGGSLDFGVDLSKSKSPAGTLTTNDPLFHPGTIGLDITRDAKTDAETAPETVLVETFGVPAAIVAGALAFVAWLRRRHP